jgi:rubredoxin-NAD+ reductase
MSDNRNDGDGVVIIGTGLAGYGAAREFRKWDKAAPLTLITADDGGWYSKPQLSAALGAGKMPDQLVLKDAATMARELDARLMTGTHVNGADAARNRLFLQTPEGPGEIGFRKLVLAVGAQARRPSIRLGEGARIHSVNNLAQYRALRESLRPGGRLAILGAGLIGCEFAHDFAAAGYRVTLIGNGPGLLPGLVPEKIASALLEALGKLGVRFLPSQSIEALHRFGAGLGRESGHGLLADLRKGETLEADAFLSAIGFEPDLDLARALGLETRRGIKVDAALRSSHPDVHALGDCAEIDGRWLPYVLPINHAAKALGLALAGKEARVAFPIMPVLIKAPSFPIAAVPVPLGAQGSWSGESDAAGASLAFRDGAGRLLGFAVAGNRYGDRSALVQEMGTPVT